MKQNFRGMAELVTAQMEVTFAGKKPASTEMYAPASLITK
jgi:hypothetical protein